MLRLSENRTSRHVRVFFGRRKRRPYISIPYVGALLAGAPSGSIFDMHHSVRQNPARRYPVDVSADPSNYVEPALMGHPSRTPVETGQRTRR